jgi:hypothetical protein
LQQPSHREVPEGQARRAPAAAAQGEGREGEGGGVGRGGEQRGGRRDAFWKARGWTSKLHSYCNSIYCL